ncbi:helix-turn-helix domain-containing protein [Roseococcus sp. DSY-14]|uniref:helix-turn-helix domain-containing protein n=1 Tax=Roseococcus sp. DSY-14 TaxID=3369650 RepID=UPI00387B25E7
MCTMGTTKRLTAKAVDPIPLAASSPPLITAALCRAARAALLWSQYDLADRSQVSRVALADWERGHSRLQRRNLQKVQAAFEAAGVQFLPEGPDGEPDHTMGLGLRFPAILPSGRGARTTGDDVAAGSSTRRGRTTSGGRPGRPRTV